MDAIAGRIDVQDVEELNYSVAPWELRMRQMAAGGLSAQLDFVQVGGMLLNRERWSHRVLAVGATPPGFLMFAGGYSPETMFKWCGEEIDSESLVGAFDSIETDFVVQNNGSHWVLLVPKDDIIDQLGDESAAAVLRGGHWCRYEPHLVGHLSALVNWVITRFGPEGGLQIDIRVIDVIRSRLLDAVAEVLLGSANGADRSTPRNRHRAYRRALNYADAAKRVISVPELAAAAGASPRVLELAFRESLGVAPGKFLRWNRMGGFHRDLRHSYATASTVTEIANRWGFTELGRTAVEYKRMFLESPSATLSVDRQPHGMRLADALPTLRPTRASPPA